MTTPSIYVACLAAYNSGILHGDWIDASLGKEFIEEGIKQILATSPEPHAEEWAIHDFENFGSIRISEFESIERVAEIAAFIDEHGELGAEVLSYCDNDFDLATEMIENYYGEYDNLADFAESLTTDCYDLSGIPQFLTYHIDWEGVARDLFIDDFVDIEVNGKYHVFSRV